MRLEERSAHGPLHRIDIFVRGAIDFDLNGVRRKTREIGPVKNRLRRTRQFFGGNVGLVRRQMFEIGIRRTDKPSEPRGRPLHVAASPVAIGIVGVVIIVAVLTLQGAHRTNIRDRDRKWAIVPDIVRGRKPPVGSAVGANLLRVPDAVIDVVRPEERTVIHCRHKNLSGGIRPELYRITIGVRELPYFHEPVKIPPVLKMQSGRGSVIGR